MKTRNILMVVITMFVLLSMTFVAQADILSTQIRCSGCFNWNHAPGGYIFWVDTGEKITLTAFSAGGTGNKKYEWTDEYGEIVSDFATLDLTSTENIKYTLVVTDDIGYITKTVEIVQSSSGSSCLPSFRSVAIQDEYRRSEYAVGDVFEVGARLKDVRECPNYNFYWEADDKNIVFTNSNSIKTDVIIGQGVRSGDITITATITDGSVVRSRDIVIKVVDNTPPEIVSIKHDSPLSYTRFNVYVDATSGRSGDEGNDFVQCSIIFKNEAGKIIDSDSKTIRSGGFNFVFRLTPEEWGIYSVEVVLKDSHGMTSAIDGETFKVKKGNTGKDIPVVFASNDVIYCKTGEICKIDTSETRRRDSNVSKFGYYYSNGEEIVNSNGDYCSGPVCKFVPTYPGTHKVKITAKYFGNDNIGSKIITVIVGENETVPVTTTITPTPTPACCYFPKNQHTPTPETSGMGFGLAITMLGIAIVMRRKK